MLIVFAVKRRVLIGIMCGLLTCLDGVSCRCRPDSGPTGGVECKLFTPIYGKYQYATCITDAYMKAKSNGSHIYEGINTKYCYYQCMLELNNIDKGKLFTCIVNLYLEIEVVSLD